MTLTIDATSASFPRIVRGVGAILAVLAIPSTATGGWIFTRLVR